MVLGIKKERLSIPNAGQIAVSYTHLIVIDLIRKRCVAIDSVIKDLNMEYHAIKSKVLREEYKKWKKELTREEVKEIRKYRIMIRGTLCGDPTKNA